MEAVLSTTRNRVNPGVAVHSVPGDLPPLDPLPPAGPPAHSPQGTRASSAFPAGTPVRSAAELPDRRYFRIGEVAVLLGVKPYVLRYWESEFPNVRPQKSRSGQRLYRRREVEALLDIRHLLHERGFTIVGARKALKEVEGLGEDQRNFSKLALADLPSQLPGNASSLPPVSDELDEDGTLPPPASVVHSHAPAAPASSQMSLALAQADTSLLEEIRDGIRDLLLLCREQ